ncbi:hypothetical protein FNAPI_14018, partial [Fusarium napiforme]
MKTAFLNIAALALTISGVFANPAPNGRQLTSRSATTFSKSAE